MPGDLSAPLNATVVDQSQFDDMKEKNQQKKKADEKRKKDLEKKKQQEERDKRLEEQRLKKQEQEKKEAEEKGLQTGYEAGWNTAHNERVALLQATKSMEDEFERFKLELSDKLLDLAVLVSKKVIADTVTLQPQQAALLLNQVLDSMQLYSKAVTLRAHPNTLRVLEAQFGDQKMLGNIRLMEDPQQLQGGFILQHPEGEVDATLQTRWLRAIEALGRNNPIAPDDLNNDSDKDSE